MIGVRDNGRIAQNQARFTLVDVNQFHSFIALRVSDIQSTYEELTAKGVEFITPPIDSGGFEMRFEIRDPAGRIIEVGEATGMIEYFDMAENTTRPRLAVAFELHGLIETLSSL